MMVYVGEWPGMSFKSELSERGWGIMAVGSRPTEYRWAFDNGAFGDARRGQPLNSSAYLKRLGRVERHAVPPDFAVIPDIPNLTGDPAGGEESLVFSLYWLRYLPMSMQWYLAVQDGMSIARVGDVLSDPDWPIAGLFLGGSDEFKQSAHKWADLAREYGIAFHFARCSSGRRVRLALEAGADSCDSAQLLRSRVQWRRWTRAYDSGLAQGTLL